MPVETAASGPDPDARIDWALQPFSEEGTKVPGDWPRVSEAIENQGFFTVQGSNPIYKTIMLKFCPEKPDEGRYEITPVDRHGKVETGRTLRVRAVPDDSTDYPQSTLTKFPTRYVVVTVDSNKANHCLAWFVGLDEYRKVPDTDTTED